MEIKTKYNVGDKLWTIKDCKAIEFEVGSLLINVNNDKKRISYYPKTDVFSTENYEEDICFSSKEELIKAL